MNMMVYNNNMLVENFIKIYESKLQLDFGLDLERIGQGDKSMAPIVYVSIINKRVSARPRTVEIAGEFIVPDTHADKWLNLKRLIEDGSDLSPYLSRDKDSWDKADYLLYCSNLHHLHLATRRGVGTEKELIFGIFTNEKFHAVHFGDHHDAYQIDTLVGKAELSWPGQLFTIGEESATHNLYDKRLANDPRLQFNLITPSGKLAGHQRTNLISLSDDKGNEIKNVPFQAWAAFDNEVLYLCDLERKLSAKHGYMAHMNLSINFKRKLYRVSVSGKNYEYKYPNMVTASSLTSSFYL
jgi:hypothetical protein